MHPNATKLTTLARRTLIPALALAMAGAFAGAAQAAPSGSPFGSGFDRAEGVDGGIRTRGWAIDPNTSNPIKARISIDGTTQAITAPDSRPDVERAFPGYGPNHGWDTVLPTSPGFHEVCVTFENVSTGADTTAGCRTVQVGGSPFGTGFDHLEGVDGGIRIKGWAIDPDTTGAVGVRVSIDDTTKTLTASTPRPDVEAFTPGYGPNHGYDTVLPAAPGNHQVCVTFPNTGYGTPTNEGCRTITVPTTTNTTTTVVNVAGTTSTGRPDSTNTGVPTGTSLSVHNGDLKITTPGTVIDGLDIRGYVDIAADNVTIRNSIVRGGPTATKNRALIAAWWGHTNITIQDTTLKAANPSYYIDGLSGSGFTATRLDISGVIDPIKVIGNNVTITDSWLHDNLHYTNDPTQSDGKSHDDSIQIQRGTNITITRNTISNAHNAAIMLTQDAGTTSSVDINNNWISGGVCTINVKGSQGTINGLNITANRFGYGSEADRCPMLLPSHSPITATSNVWDTNNTPAKPNWY